MKKTNHGKVQKKRQEFSELFKRKVCAEYLHSGCSMEFLKRKYKLKGHSAIRNWLNKYSDIEAQKPLKTVLMSSESSKTAVKTAPKEENLLLKEKIKSLETDKLLLEAMLEIVAEDYGIDVRKKFGAGQSKK